MFYKEKPIDWLLDHILWVKVCNPEKDAVSFLLLLKCFSVSECVVSGELKASIQFIVVTTCPERICFPTKISISSKPSKTYYSEAL